MICSVKEVKKLFVPKWKILRLNEDSTKVMFENEFKRLTQVSGQKTGIEAIWNYDTKRTAGLQRSGNVLRREDDKAQVFKIVKQMTITNHNTVGDKCEINDRGDMGNTWLGESITRDCLMRKLSRTKRT